MRKWIFGFIVLLLVAAYWFLVRPAVSVGKGMTAAYEEGVRFGSAKTGLECLQRTEVDLRTCVSRNSEDAGTCSIETAAFLAACFSKSNNAEACTLSKEALREKVCSTQDKVCDMLADFAEKNCGSAPKSANP